MSNSVGHNPYAVTTTTLAMPGAGSDVEAIRKKYLSHEVSVKSIGTLYMLGAVLGGIGTVIYVIGAVVTLTQPDQAVVAILMLVAGTVAAGLSILYFFIARGLWDLQPWSRIVATVFSAIGLIGFPIGTLISAYFLYLLQSQKGSMVFSNEYKEVIAATPHIQYKTSIIVWILLGLLLAVILLSIMSLAIGLSVR